MTIEKPTHQSLNDLYATSPRLTWVQKPNPSLRDLVARVLKGASATIPTSSLTKEERLLLEGDEPMNRYMTAVNHKSNRDLVIQMVGTLEDSYSRLLQNFAVENIGEQLFKRRGDVKDFGLRISLAYALGLTSEFETMHARLLARIRNSFAHDPDLFEFDHDDKVVSAIKQLGQHQKDFPLDQIPIRIRFFGYAVSLIRALDDRSEEALLKRCKEYTGLTSTAHPSAV